MLHQIKNAPMASMAKVKAKMFSKVESNELRVSAPIKSRTANWRCRVEPPIKKRAKKLVMVIMPSPPTCISKAMMS